MAKNKYLSLDALPNSQLEPLIITSMATGDYNCIAWVLEDVRHTLSAISGGIYGNVALVFKKKI